MAADSTFAIRTPILRTLVHSTCVVATLTCSAFAAAQRVATTQPGVSMENVRVTIDADQTPLLTVLHSIARQAGLTPIYDAALIPVSRVTLHARDIPVRDAFQRTLNGTGLVARVRPEGDVSIGHIEAGDREARLGGRVTGRVIDAATKRPLSGVTITVDDASRGIVTNDDGIYHVLDIPAGTHTLTARLLGHGHIRQTVTVTDGQAIQLDFFLSAQTTVLGQVVVTGTIIPTELRAVPNAITVITAKQIEERGITRIDQLFRGDVPGVFAPNQGSLAFLDAVAMYSRGATALSGASGGAVSSNFLTNPIKTYVDGVELADSKYLSQIDPKSIERIEILTGPQASTIYGSNAINGVMQVFTKRGTTSTPQLTLNLQSGIVQNNFSNALTPQHDYSAQLNGIEGRLSYNAGGAWNYMGPWTPAKQTTRTNGFGGTRLELPTPAGRVTADVTLRLATTQNQQRGIESQTITGYRETGWWSPNASVGLSVPTTYVLTGQTLGLTLGYASTNWLSHELGIGQDASNTEIRYTARGYTSASDTTLRLDQTRANRRSLRYTTTAQIPVTTMAKATVTVGADAWQSLSSRIVVQPQTLTGSLANVTTLTRQPDHNTGSFLQTQLAIKDQIFLTYGLRAEWNPNYGAEAEPNYAPRYGVAYTRDIQTPLGAVTAKLRASYGRSTRPPAPGLKVAQDAASVFGSSSSAVAEYGNFMFIVANPELAPEYQQGGEGGLELYAGTHGSLVVTRYNQTINALIGSPKVDSVRSLAINPTSGANSHDVDGYGYRWMFEYVNIGSIRNQGWELQGTINAGPLTTHATYNWTKSRTIGVNPTYRAYFANARQYQPGATFNYVPEHVWAAGMTYTSAANTLGLNLTGTGRATDLENDFYLRNLSGTRLPQNRFNVTNTGWYFSFNRGYVLADLNASHRFTTRLEGTLLVQNLANRYENDFDAGYATMGRQSKLGIRARW